MFNQINFNKFLLNIICGIIILELNNFSSINCQEKFLLDDNEISGYELIDKSRNSWNIDEGFQNHDAIRQKWHPIGGDDRDNIYIDYCEFKTELDAIQGTAYASISNTEPYIWGSLTGFIVGDGSWVFIRDGGLFFLRGNLGINIFKPLNFKESDRQILVSISNQLLNKIESNLSDEILSFEQSAKQNQITSTNYHMLTDSVVNSDRMSEFSLHSEWDSKWKNDAEGITLGIRKEWKNEKGTIVSIDICEFASNSAADEGSNFRAIVSNFNGRVFQNLDSLELILQLPTESIGLFKNIYHVVGVKENIALHVYFFDPEGIDKNFVYDIAKSLSKYISNF